jgi:2-keto-4-pentenoate hydratase
MRPCPIELLGAGDDEQVLGRTAQPRVEPEIAFGPARDLDRPLTLRTAERAIDGVAVTGHPLRTLLHLSEHLARRGAVCRRARSCRRPVSGRPPIGTG